MKRETKDWGHHALKKEDTVRGIRGWFKRNRKVLYWPLGWLVYVVLAMFLSIIVPWVGSVFLFPILSLIALIVNPIDSIFGYIPRGDSGVILETFIVIEAYLFLVSYLYYTRNVKLSKIILITLFVVIVLILTLSIFFPGRISADV